MQLFYVTKKGDTGRLEKITWTAGKITRADPLRPSNMFRRAALRKLASSQADTSLLVNGVVQSSKQPEVPDNMPAKQLHPHGDQTAQSSPLTVYLVQGACASVRHILCVLCCVCVCVCVCVVCVCVTVCLSDCL